MIPTASEMGDAISAVAYKLLDAGVLENSAANVAHRTSSSLKRLGANRAWRISVPREDGFVFAPLEGKDGTYYKPSVAVDRIVTNPECSHLFAHLDIALQIDSVEGGRYARWHFDMANKQGDSFQEGPLFHLQFGGHSPGFPGFWIDLPRWAHPPMDLVLMLEAVAANFYPRAWATQLRDDPSWCEHISQSERLCLSSYVRRVSALVDARSTTVLGTLWARA